AEAKRLKDQIAEGDDREAMFMGLGDIVIPSVLIVSSLEFLEATTQAYGLPGNVLVGGATFLGALGGFAFLMAAVMRGKPQAGLPALNGGAIIGFFVALLPLYGIAPLLP
ncbi:MAG: presenilin family intramembrane aspartyl protease, partial [Methanobacteriota archaeon]